ncbi:MAG: M24 family metallopeptidase [Bacteroidia bacterium]|nr:M24 family metallopeptidase [Bacteroidia bacterium]
MIRKLFIVQALLCVFVLSNAAVMEAPLLQPDFYKIKREALRELMPENSVAILFSYPVKSRSNDVDFRYKANPDLFYLSGFDNQDAMLLVFKNEQEIDGKKSDHLMVIPARDAKYESWNGKRMSKGDAKRELHLDAVTTTDLINKLPVSLSAFDKVFVQYPNGDLKAGPSRKNGLDKVVNNLKRALAEASKKPNKTDLKEWMAELRQVKSEGEIALIQKAINATGNGLVSVMKTIEPGMTESQAQGIIEFHFKAAGSEYPGFPSIIGSGENACILHYIDNKGKLNADDMLLMDVGAEMNGYSADVTRTIPVDGVFSEEQKAIYNLVLKAQLAGIEDCQVGNSFMKPHMSTRAIIAKGLVKLGIMDDESQVSTYFPHGTSHYLGMDVHDVGTYGKLEEGVVLTVEPGIYINAGSPCDQKWWNIGIRIEDDILVTENGPQNLSGHIPKEVEEIEAVMKENSPFNGLIKNSND